MVDKEIDDDEGDRRSITTVSSSKEDGLQRQHYYIFLCYAARYWAEHFTQVGTEPEPALIETVALNTYDASSKSFRNWLSIFDRFNYLAMPSTSIYYELRNATNLIMASYFGHVIIVKRLLGQKGPLLNSTDNTHDQTALKWAAFQGHEAVVKLLLEREDVHADPKDHQYRTPLMWAAEGGHEAIVKLLSGREDVQINHKDIAGYTPLRCAVEYGHEAIIKLLLARKDLLIDSKDELGGTALSWAVLRGDEAITKLLLEHGAQANLEDDYGETPLMQAARRNHGVIAKLLLEYGAQVDLEDEIGRMALSFAEHEAKIDARNKNDETSLMMAAQYESKWWLNYF